MIRQLLMSTTLVTAALLATACEKKPAAPVQAPEAQVSELQAQPAPTAAERTVAEAGNEVEQVASTETPFTQAELAAGLPAASVPNPATTLATASVQSPTGQKVGEVRSVVVSPNGMASAVVIEVGGFLNVGERAVSVDASRFTFLKDRNILVVAATKEDLEKMPAMPAAVK